MINLYIRRSSTYYMPNILQVTKELIRYCIGIRVNGEEPPFK